MRILPELFAKNIRAIILINCFTCLFFFLNPADISAREIVKRPKVGLVLSGGGARGIAHIGVIKVMEEAGLRPDYITGVSMGSIIGGLYSLGYSADSLQKLLNQVNWDAVLSNKIGENKVIFLEKAHFYHSMISLPLSFSKVILPSGLISGQQFENTLSFYAWPAADINDFSKLPIPFMCLGTDIITFKKIDLKTGYLSDAIRASSSVPSIFTPLKIDSLLLLDGGLVRNFAASEIREMGADIVIGSYTGFHPFIEDELKTVPGIMKQIGLNRGLDDFEKQKKLVDVLIKPDVDEFTRFGFENIDSIIKKGYEAALPYKKYFRELADSLNLIGTQKHIENILDKQSYSFNKIEIAGNKIYSDSQILSVLDIKPGEKVDKYLLTDRIELLYGNAWFDKVKYRVVPRNDSLILVIDCIEKPQAMLYGSIHYDNSLLAGVILETSVKNFFTQRSVINLNSFIGQFYRLKLDYLQFIDINQKFGLSAIFYSDNTMIPMLELRGNKGKVISRNFIPGLSFNRRFGLNNMMSLTANYENLNLILRYDSDVPLRNLSFNYLSTTYEYQVNTVDTKHYPNKGTIFNISAGTSKLLSGGIKTDSSKVVFKGNNHGEFSFDRFFSFYGNIRYYFSPYDKLTFEIGGDALFITDSDAGSLQNNFYFLGGVESLNKRSVPLIGFHSNEIPVQKLAGFRAELDLEVFENLHLNLMSNIFAVHGVRTDNEFSILTGLGLGAGFMSFLGPIKIGLMYGNYNNEKYFNKIKGFISMGYNF